MRSTRAGAIRGLTAASVAVLCLAQVLPTTAGSPGPGRLDRSFNGSGRAIVAFPGETAQATELAMQGKRIVVVGGVGYDVDLDFAVIRLTADGHLDRTFAGGDGRFVRDMFGDADIATAVEVLPDRSILVAGQGYHPGSGTGRFVVLRLTPNGRLDRAFGGGDGIVITRFEPAGALGRAMTLLPQGRFAVCGHYASDPDRGFALAVYRANGNLYRGFGLGGQAVTPFPGMTDARCEGLTSLGAKLVAVGSVNDAGSEEMAAAMYRRDGMLDDTFNTDGRATFAPAPNFSEANDVLTLPGGTVVIAGTASDGLGGTDVALVRVRDDGTPDPAFGGGDGWVVEDLGAPDQGLGVARQRGGALIVTGFRNPDMFVARFTPTGALDDTFAGDGIQAKPWDGLSIGSAVVISRGKVVVAGSMRPGSRERFAVERLFT